MRTARSTLFGEDNEKEDKPEPIIRTIEWGHYLSEIWKELPPGLISKNATGSGATTLEFECERSSIIVFPTRALAASKAQKHNSYYIGGEYKGISKDSNSKIKEDIGSGRRIKIAVVADSLLLLIDDLGDIVFSYFHLTIELVWQVFQRLVI